MSRVLLLCPEPLGHGQPAGVGIRFLEIARVLRGDGHGVTILSPDKGTIDGCRGEYITPDTLLQVSAASDVAVIQGHVANAFFMQAHPIPTVIDLYDPYIIENLHYYEERGPEVFSHDHATLTNSLLRGDLFLCASEAQRLFYLGALLAVGRLHPIAFENSPRLESLVRIAPFGVQPPRAVAARDLDAPAILFGGIYDWYDPILAIDAIAIARQSLPGTTLTFTTHPNPEITPQGKLAEAVAHVKRHRYDDFVRFEPWVAYEERAAFFDRFALALLTFPPSIETDLAMRTRVYDYLWCGLPIVTSSASGTDEILARYDAGAVLDSESAEAFAGEVVAIVRDRERYARMTRGSQELVREHQWARTLEPLREFCRAPHVDATKESFVSPPPMIDRPPSILSRLKRRLAR
jgi:glycosyltransferase involved in cell wall biosynthesis